MLSLSFCYRFVRHSWIIIIIIITEKFSKRCIRIHLQQEEEKQFKIRQCELDVFVQEFIYKDNLTKKELEYIILELYCSIENEKYTSYIHSMYQKITRNIKEYGLDLKFYDDKQNEKYIDDKKELEQKYEEELR